jgi:N-acyl-D-aspartate/D-glutamate deacylase
MKTPNDLWALGCCRRYIMVNGEITFEDGEPTGAFPGRLLRNGLPRPPAQERAGIDCGWSRF